MGYRLRLNTDEDWGRGYRLRLRQTKGLAVFQMKIGVRGAD